MVDFRKLVLALVAGALLFAAVGSAQVVNPYSCFATAVPTLARSEGHAERMGDILLTCSGQVPVAGILANIRLRLTANVTSKALNKDRSRLEANLIKDEIIAEGGWGYHGYGTTPGEQNVWQASRISDDEIEWAGVWLAAPNSNVGAQTIRLTNVRGDVDSRGDFATIYASINIVSPTSVPVNNNLLVVADTRPGLVFSVTSADYKNCVIPGSTTWKMSFKEGYASAFLPVGVAADDNVVPGGGYLNESGWNPGEGLVAGTLTAGGGQASQGTRLMARIKDVPTGASLYVPWQVTTSAGMVACIVPDTDSSGATGTMACSGTTSSYPVPASGLVVYEVQGPLNTTSYSTQETVEVNVTVDYTVPGPLGTAKANGTLAPLSTIHTMSSTAPVPRFIDRATDSTAFSISACRTILLFPYVTQQAAFDTGIIVSNTSRDPIGTVNQSGVCSLYFYGNTNGSTGPTSPQVTPSISAGSHFAMALSGGGGVWAYNGGFTACASGNCVAPLFEGYIVAICNFQFAHGYAFISDFGAQKLAQGYLALIIPDRGETKRAPDNDGRNAAANDGEGLSN